MYSIKLKDGHQYNFNNYRKIRMETTKEGVKVLVIEVQYKERQRYKTVRILPETIKTTTLDTLRRMIIFG